MSSSLTRNAHRNPMPIPTGERVTVHKDGSVTVHIPINFKRHGGRKYIIAPTQQAALEPAQKDSLVNMLVRAFHWQEMMDADESLTQESLGKKEGIAKSYVSRLLRLALLAPDIVEMILDGKQPQHIRLVDIEATGFDWNEQRKLFGLA